MECPQAWQHEPAPVAQDSHRIDEKSLETRAAEFPTSDIGDAPMRPELLDQIRSRRSRRSPASPPTAPSTPASATTPSPRAVPRRSSRLARTPSPGSPTQPGLSPATRSCAHRSASGGQSGDDGAAITAEAAQKPRCTASSCWVSAYPHASSTVRSRSSRCASPCSTASPRSARPSQRSQDKSVRGKGKSDQQPICATKPCRPPRDLHGCRQGAAGRRLDACAAARSHTTRRTR